MNAPFDANVVLPGVVAVVAPHMDDELIGCGAILASLRDGSRAHVIYAADGSASPVSIFPWRRTDRRQLARARREEARAGLRELGVPPENAHFLDLPDSRLPRVRPQLEQRLVQAIEPIGPDHVLIPFRFDCQSDHLAVSRAARAMQRRGRIKAEMFEYFVYARWKLIHGGDIRRHVRPELLLRFDTNDEARSRKRRALQTHRSQTTRFYDWQKRVNLTGDFIDGTCVEPEYLLRSDAEDAPLAVFAGGTLRIRVVHAIEPRLKKGKDLVMEILRG